MEHPESSRPEEPSSSSAMLNRTLASWAAVLGTILNNEQTEKLTRFCELVCRANARTNLTGTLPLKEIARKHAADSLAAAPILKSSRTLLDIGSGGGFPGLPLKIAVPSIHAVLLESSGKKCRFLSGAASSLGLSGIEVMNERAETAGKNNCCRERFDAVVCRAVSGMSVISEYALPFLKHGGIFIAYKGPGALEEIDQSAKAIHFLGGKLAGIKEYELPVKTEKRLLVIVKKTHPTPDQFPRREGIARKRPLVISD